MDCALLLKTRSMWPVLKPVVVIRHGAIPILPQWSTRCVWSNFCSPVLAALAKPFATSWLSAFWVRIIFTAPLLTHTRRIVCRVGRRADRLPRLRAIWWSLRWERIRADLPAFPQAIAESGASDHRITLYRLLA